MGPDRRAVSPRVLLLASLCAVLVAGCAFFAVGAAATPYPVHVVGQERGGILFYRYRGQDYTRDMPGLASVPRVDVYLDPADPTVAGVQTPSTRIANIAFNSAAALGCLLAAAALARAARRRYRRLLAHLSG